MAGAAQGPDGVHGTPGVHETPTMATRGRYANRNNHYIHSSSIEYTGSNRVIERKRHVTDRSPVHQSSSILCVYRVLFHLVDFPLGNHLFSSVEHKFFRQKR